MIDETWIFLAGLLAVGVAAIWRLMCLEARIDERDRNRKALKSLSERVVSGNRILEQCGRPESWHNTVEPMYFLHHCRPQFIAWNMDIRHVFSELAPDYLAKFENAGDIYQHPDSKPLMVQQLEGRLQRLGEIIDELRGQL